MYRIMKKKGNTVWAYQLNQNHPVLSQLMSEGKLRKKEEGLYEVMSQEAFLGESNRGQLVREDDYIKINEDGYPYPNESEFFEKNHHHIAGDCYEQIPREYAAWDLCEPMCEEVVYLMREKGLVIDRKDPERCFTARLWDTVESAPEDAVIIFYDIFRDDSGKILDIRYNFIIRKEFENTYQIIRNEEGLRFPTICTEMK